MRAWMIRNLERFLWGVASSPGGRALLEAVLDDTAECPFCRGVERDELRDVEDDMRRAAEALADCVVEGNSERPAWHPSAAVPVTLARRALVDARTKLFHALNPNADAADVHDALFRGDA